MALPSVLFSPVESASDVKKKFRQESITLMASSQLTPWSPSPAGYTMGRGGKSGGHVPKAHVVKRRGRGLGDCNHAAEKVQEGDDRH